MRYTYSSRHDIDRTLEAFKYARRSLLVVMALALPFAAWDAVSSGGIATQPAVPATQTVKQLEPAAEVAPLPVVRPLTVCERDSAPARIGDAAV
jgi:hypothetical protein